LKLGTENRKEMILLAVVGVIAVIMAARAFWPSAPEAAPTSATPPPSGGFTRVSARRTASGRVVKPAEPRLDPTLQLDLLSRSEGTEYAGVGRNIFVTGSLPIENPKANGTTDKAKQYSLPTIPPPPPINLKFFGFASKPGEPKRVFLSKGDDVFIAGEGDIVDRRYRVLRISPASVDVEDLLNNNRQSIPLTLG
jgi:hypothetical protein